MPWSTSQCRFALRSRAPRTIVASPRLQPLFCSCHGKYVPQDGTTHCALHESSNSARCRRCDAQGGCETAVPLFVLPRGRRRCCGVSLPRLQTVSWNGRSALRSALYSTQRHTTSRTSCSTDERRRRARTRLPSLYSSSPPGHDVVDALLNMSTHTSQVTTTPFRAHAHDVK